MKVSVWEIIGNVRSGVTLIDADGKTCRALPSDDGLSPPHLCYNGSDREVCFESVSTEHDGTVSVDVMPVGDRRALLIRELAEGVICVRIGDTEISIELEWRAAEMRVQRASGAACP